MQYHLLLTRFVIVAAAFFIVQRRISFGPMRKHESIAINDGNMFGGKKPRLSDGLTSRTTAWYTIAA